jgi:hypothetical protein
MNVDDIPRDASGLRRSVPVTPGVQVALNLCDPRVVLSPPQLKELHEDLDGLANDRRRDAANAGHIIIS